MTPKGAPSEAWVAARLREIDGVVWGGQRAGYRVQETSALLSRLAGTTVSLAVVEARGRTYWCVNRRDTLAPLAAGKLERLRVGDLNLDGEIGVTVSAVAEGYRRRGIYRAVLRRLRSLYKCAIYAAPTIAQSPAAQRFWAQHGVRGRGGRLRLNPPVPRRFWRDILQSTYACKGG